MSNTKSVPRTCEECGAELGAGYLCDACDTVEVLAE